MSLDDLRSDLAQVAPAKTEEDLDLFASELRLLLSNSESERQKSGSVLDKKALWERVTAEIDRHEEDRHEESEGGTPKESGNETPDALYPSPLMPGSPLTDTPKSQD
jgi:hypothetical protein